MNDINKIEEHANYEVTATMDADAYSLVAAVLIDWAGSHQEPIHADAVKAIQSIKWERTR